MKNIKKANIKAYIENDELYLMVEEKYKMHCDKEGYVYNMYEEAVAYGESGLSIIEEYYKGSTVIIEDDAIVDIMDSEYDGYYNAKVKKVAEIIGYSKNESMMVRKSLKIETPNKDYIMGKKYNQMDLDIDGMKFETGLWYVYNPFMNHIKMIPYISNDSGMFCWHSKTVQERYNKKYVEEILGLLKYKKAYYRFDNCCESWVDNLTNEKLTIEINAMFKYLLYEMDVDYCQDYELDDYIELSGNEFCDDEYVTNYGLFYMYLSLLTTTNNYDIIFEKLTDISNKIG
jgi:hypothetical protein